MYVIIFKCYVYLPCLYADSSHRAMHVYVSDSDIWDTCFTVIPSQTPNTDAMSRSAIYTVYVYIRASCLYGYTIITCIQLFALDTATMACEYVILFNIQFLCNWN